MQALSLGIVGDGVIVDPENVLSGPAGLLRMVVVVGIDLDGELYVAGSHGTAESHLLLGRASADLVERS